MKLWTARAENYVLTFNLRFGLQLYNQEHYEKS